MNELQLILDKIESIAQVGESVRIATLVRAEGSTYRDVGARMLIGDTGSIYGSISGGCLEGDIFDSALRMGANSLLKEYDTTSEEDIYWGTGMGCGGKTTVLIEKLSDFYLYLKLKDYLTQRIPCVAVTIFNSEDPTLRGLCLVSNGADTHARKTELTEICNALVKDVLNKRRSIIRSIEYHGQTLEALFELIEPVQQIALFGDGHDIVPVLDVCVQLGWQVHIIATKEALAIKERYPKAASVDAWHAGKNVPDKHTACVIMTHNFLLDKEILRILLPADVPYIGFLGPGKRGARLLNEVLEEGLEATKEQVNRYFSPIGLDIGAASANEIAVSVVAEILSVLRDRNGGNLRDRQGPIHGRKAIDQ